MVLKKEFILHFRAEFFRFISACISYMDEWKSIALNEVFSAADQFSILELIEKNLWEDWSFFWEDIKEAINSILCFVDMPSYTACKNPDSGLLLIVEAWLKALDSFCFRETYLEEAIEHKRSNS